MSVNWMSIDKHKKFQPWELRGWVLNCPGKSLSQSKDNRQGEPQGCMECQQTLPGLSWCSYTSVDTQIFGIWGNFNLMEKAFLFGLSVWKFLYLLSGYLCMCMQKHVSGWPIFMVDFNVWSWRNIQNLVDFNWTQKHGNMVNMVVWYITCYVLDECSIYRSSALLSALSAHAKFSGRCHFYWQEQEKIPLQ